MDCKQIQLCTDDFLDGTLPVGEQQLAREHLANCAACRTELGRLQELRHALRALPVPPPSADFTSRVFADVRRHRQLRQRTIGGLGAALAASLVLWFGAALFQPNMPSSGLDTIVMGVSDVREVKLVFTAPENFQDVTLQLEFSGNIELTGYRGRQSLEWQTRLKKGSNTLVLPITATGHGQAEVVAKIKHAGKIRTFRVPVQVQNAGGRANFSTIPMSV